ncbi:hypothetical protein LSM04_006126 [Trypanosoma melophagium]|uniref:uncharacterized protein n=1 Tax=Trypanosoma melophagium TaxID=715481 RepID=UPI00351A1611|nr:hypothetical protein LSM04_006126 [Trypanosoma melophagium]
MFHTRLLFKCGDSLGVCGRLRLHFLQLCLQLQHISQSIFRVLFENCALSFNLGHFTRGAISLRPPIAVIRGDLLIAGNITQGDGVTAMGLQRLHKNCGELLQSGGVWKADMYIHLLG